MENQQFKQLICALSESLEISTLVYLNNHFKEEEESGHILNLILSGYLSALTNIMRSVSRENEGVKNNVDTFINKLLEFIKSNCKMEFDIINRK